MDLLIITYQQIQVKKKILTTGPLTHAQTELNPIDVESTLLEPFNNILAT